MQSLLLKHAVECQQMAKATRDPATKATWNRMAERWAQCAERAKSQSVTTHPRIPVRRHAVSSVSPRAPMVPLSGLARMSAGKTLHLFGNSFPLWFRGTFLFAEGYWPGLTPRLEQERGP